MTTPVVLDITGRVDPALLSGVAQLSHGFTAVGAASEASATRSAVADSRTHEGIRTTNELLRNLRETGNQGMGELSQKASEMAGQMGGAAGTMADVGIKTLAAFGPVGLQITAVMGAVMMLSRAYDEHQAAVERTRVISESTAAATAMLGGAYAEVATAAREATTAEAARLAVAQQIQSITAEQVTTVGAGFTQGEAQGLVSAYHGISAASQIAGTTVARFTAAQVEHAVSSGSMAEQMMVLGIAIERSTNAQVEHSNVLRRAAAATREAARDAVAAAEAQAHSRDVNQSSTAALRTLVTNTTALETARAALTAQTRTSNAVEAQQLATQRELNAVAADRLRVADRERERLLAKDETEKQVAHNASPAGASGPTAAQRAQAALASQAAARAMVEQMDADRIERGAAAAEAAANDNAMLDRLMSGESVDPGKIAEQQRLDELANTQALAATEKDILNASLAAHETYAGRLAELNQERVHGAQRAAEFTNSAFESMGKAIGTHVQALIDGKESVGQALQGMLSDTLISVGKEAVIQGGMEMAKGVAALAGVVTAPLAPGHFAAGAAFLAVGAAAGVAGAALAPSAAAPSAGAGAGNGGAGGSLRDSAGSSGESMAPININYYAPVIGGREATDAELGTRLDRFDNAARQRLRRAA